MKKIDIDLTSVDEIYHLADVHIRLFKRHDEYREVFSRLYEQFKQSTAINKIIVVAGDIVHAKTDMSPEMLELASEFLRSLADIAPTFIIAGNHDLNLSNKNRLDSLTPIVASLNHKNLIYLKHSGVYQVADVDFAVFSILDEPSDWPTVSDTRADAKKIGLFHGPVHGALTDTNYVITNRHVDISSFDGFDAVLLGDIHRYQVLQSRTKTTPVIVYASSLIQQNHGETVAGHGWCKWSLKDFSHTFIPVHNTYGYYTLEIVSDKIVIPADMPENVRLRLIAKGMDATDIKKATAAIRTHRNVIELSLSKTAADTPASVDPLATDLTIDVTNVNNQNKLIKDWIERTYDTVDDTLLQKILNINTKINSTVTYDDHSRNVHWRPLRFTFSNMFSYGDKNEINFDALKGIYGIFAPNATGKSSSIDALMFCLYDKTPRAFRGDHIMNNRCDTFECELQLEINNEFYFIRRTGAKKKNGDVKVDVFFWREAEDGTQISLNGEDRRDTNAIIRSYVGTYEDFVLTTLSSQNASSLFIDKSHSERKDLLIQFMGLNIFDILHDTAKEEMKEVTSILKKFSKTDFTQTLASTQAELDAARQTMLQLETDAVRLRSDKDTLYAQLKSLQETRLPVPTAVTDINQIHTNLSKVKHEIATSSEQIVEYERDIEALRTTLAQISQELSAHNFSELTSSATAYDELSANTEKMQAVMAMREKDLLHLNSRKKSLETYKFDPTCGFCTTNGRAQIDELKNITERIHHLTMEHDTQCAIVEAARQQLLSLQEAKTIYDYLSNRRSVYASTEVEIDRRTLHVAALNSRLETLELKYRALQQETNLYAQHESNIVFNKKLDENILHIEETIAVTTRSVDALEKQLRDMHGKISVLETSKADIIKQIAHAEELEDMYEAYKYYMHAVGRDGVPHEIMVKVIPEIQNEINQLLSQIVNFTIALEIDGKNILGRLSYDNERIWPLENSSGMERFISSLAIRVALINASNLPKPNFLIIDEGLGSLDSENLSGMSTLFGILKSQFEFMIVISHLDAVRDMVDKVLDIKREDGFSYINV